MTEIETVRLLVVSREPAVLRLLWSIEESDSWQLEAVASGWDAMERVQSGAVPDLLLLDIPRGDTDSLHLLRWLHRLRPDLPVIVLCYLQDAARGEEATRLGAEEIVVRPLDKRQLKSVIRRHLGPEASAAGNGKADTVSENVEQLGPDAFFVSASLMMQKLRAQAALLAQTDVPVLILGEAGSGKYTVASLIHKLSVRSGFKLVRVNCAEMPEALLENELFGEEPASSGSARRTCLGKFAVGEKGTIFLDEIAEMPAGLQSRLLQVLNDEFHRPGSADAIPTDVRILAASSANLERALAEKKLREDLYYRLSAFTVHVPPLRQRRDEIAILLRCFMHKLAKHYSLPPREFSLTALDACRHYSWPGNLEELETFVKRYLVAGDQELTLGEMELKSADSADSTLRSEAVRSVATPLEERESGKKQPQPESLTSLIQGIKSEAEQTAIGAALKRTGWNRKAAARLLRVSYRTLLYKIDQYHMRAPEPFLSPPPVEEFSVFGNEIKDDGKAS
ncbi:MAG: sigma-54 dependent transcriptional regulator [Candidatus Sulfotelmatobacter sp.]